MSPSRDVRLAGDPADSPPLLFPDKRAADEDESGTGMPATGGRSFVRTAIATAAMIAIPVAVVLVKLLFSGR